VSIFRRLSGVIAIACPLIAPGGIYAIFGNSSQETELPAPILEDESTQMKTLHDDTSLAPEDKRAKMKKLHESSTEKINAVLTPDQQSKWKQMKQEMMEKHKGEMKGQGQVDHQ
jgi:hypothetical protein